MCFSAYVLFDYDQVFDKHGQAGALVGETFQFFLPDSLL